MTVGSTAPTGSGPKQPATIRVGGPDSAAVAEVGVTSGPTPTPKKEAPDASATVLADHMAEDRAAGNVDQALQDATNTSPILQRETDGKVPTLQDDPEFKAFMDDPENGLGARVFKASMEATPTITTLGSYAQQEQIIDNVRSQMEEEFAVQHPDIVARYNSATVPASESTQSPNDSLKDAADPVKHAETKGQIPDEVRNDPEFQRQLGEAVLQKQGEAVDMADLTQQVFEDYNKKSGAVQEGGGAAQTTAEQISPTEQRLSQLEQQVEKLSSQNNQLREAMTQMVPLIQELVQKQAVQEQDPKKKQTLLAKLLALLAVAGFLTVSGVSAGVKGLTSNQTA